MRLCHSHSENLRVLSEKNGLTNQIIGYLDSIGHIYFLVRLYIFQETGDRKSMFLFSPANTKVPTY